MFYCAGCSSKLRDIRVFLKKFDGIFFFFRLGTYNVPSGSSDSAFTTKRPKADFSGGVGGIKFEFWWGVSSFSGRWEAFFCEKLKKEEPFFFLIFFVNKDLSRP